MYKRALLQREAVLQRKIRIKHMNSDLNSQTQRLIDSLLTAHAIAVELDQISLAIRLLSEIEALRSNNIPQPRIHDSYPGYPWGQRLAGYEMSAAYLNIHQLDPIVELRSAQHTLIGRFLEWVAPMVYKLNLGVIITGELPADGKVKLTVTMENGSTEEIEVTFKK